MRIFYFPERNFCFEIVLQLFPTASLIAVLFLLHLKLIAELLPLNIDSRGSIFTICDPLLHHYRLMTPSCATIDSLRKHFNYGFCLQLMKPNENIFRFRQFYGEKEKLFAPL